MGDAMIHGWLVGSPDADPDAGKKQLRPIRNSHRTRSGIGPELSGRIDMAAFLLQFACSFRENSSAV